MSDHYILVGGEPVSVDLMTWARSMESASTRRLALDEIAGVRVSTVFLGIDHSFGDGPPLLFETMIFGGWHAEYQERYSALQEAAYGHARALALVKRLRWIPVSLQSAIRKGVDAVNSCWWRMRYRIRQRAWS